MVSLECVESENKALNKRKKYFDVTYTENSLFISYMRKRVFVVDNLLLTERRNII